MRSVKLIARNWIKNPIEDVLWVVTRKNNMNVKFKARDNYIRAFCQDKDFDNFRRLARRFCLVCDYPTAC
jgi:hypothetical protein